MIIKILKTLLFLIFIMLSVIFTYYKYLSFATNLTIPANRNFLEINNLKISYGFVDNNANKNVLIVGGTGSHFGTWDFVLEKFSKDYNYYVLELPPFGYSETLESYQYSTLNQADLIENFIKIKNIKNITAISHSFGNIPLMEVILRNPDYFIKFIIVDGASILKEKKESGGIVKILLSAKFIINPLAEILLSQKKIMEIQLKSLVYDKKVVTQFWVDRYFEPINHKNNIKNSTKWFTYFMFEEEKNLLQQNPDNFKKINFPVFIVWGDKDLVTPVNQAENLNQLFRESKLILMENVGHMPMIEDENKFNDILNEILK